MFYTKCFTCMINALPVFYTVLYCVCGASVHLALGMYACVISIYYTFLKYWWSILSSNSLPVTDVYHDFKISPHTDSFLSYWLIVVRCHTVWHGATYSSHSSSNLHLRACYMCIFGRFLCGKIFSGKLKWGSMRSKNIFILYKLVCICVCVLFTILNIK